MPAPRHRIVLLVLAGVALLCPASPAPAATVSIATTTDPDSKIEEIAEQHVVFRARPGERNAVRISLGDTVTVSDSGAPLAAGEGCVRSSRGISCDVQELRGALVDLGDGNDRLALAGTVGGPFVTRPC